MERPGSPAPPAELGDTGVAGPVELDARPVCELNGQDSTETSDVPRQISETRVVPGRLSTISPPEGITMAANLAGPQPGLTHVTSFMDFHQRQSIISDGEPSPSNKP